MSPKNRLDKENALENRGGGNYNTYLAQFLLRTLLRYVLFVFSVLFVLSYQDLPVNSYFVILRNVVNVVITRLLLVPMFNRAMYTLWICKASCIGFKRDVLG